MPPIKIRYSNVQGALFIVLGILMLLVAVIGDGFSVSYVTGAVFILLGTCFVFGTAAIIHPHLVEVKSPIQITMKSEPIHGLQDLIVVKNTLTRRGDGKKLLNMGWGSVDKGDLEQIRRTVGWQP